MTRAIAIIIVSLSLAGCSSPQVDLPAITGDEIILSHQNPLFSVEINADKVVDHGAYVTADRVQYRRGGRITSTFLLVKGYRRDKGPQPIHVNSSGAEPTEDDD